MLLKLQSAVNVGALGFLIKTIVCPLIGLISQLHLGVMISNAFGLNSQNYGWAFIISITFGRHNFNYNWM
jgi:hypothetical protein